MVVAKGKIRIEGDAKDVLEMYKAIDKASKKTATTTKKETEKASKSFDSNMQKMQKSAKTMMNFMQGAFAASIIKSGFDQIKVLEATNVRMAFLKQSNKELASAIGDVEQATVGYLKASDAISAANVLQVSGIKMNKDEFVKYTEAVTIMSLKLGRDPVQQLEKFTTGLNRQRVMLVDDLIPSIENNGIVWDRYAKTLGKTSSELTDSEKKIAFVENALKKLNEQITEADKKTLNSNTRFTQQINRGEKALLDLYRTGLSGLGAMADQSEKTAGMITDYFMGVKVYTKEQRETLARLKAERTKAHALALKQYELEKKAFGGIIEDAKSKLTFLENLYSKIQKLTTGNEMVFSNEDSEAVNKQISDDEAEKERQKSLWKEKYAIALNYVKIGEKKITDFNSAEDAVRYKNKQIADAKLIASNRAVNKKQLEDLIYYSNAEIKIKEDKDKKLKELQNAKAEELKNEQLTVDQKVQEYAIAKGETEKAIEEMLHREKLQRKKVHDNEILAETKKHNKMVAKYSQMGASVISGISSSLYQKLIGDSDATYAEIAASAMEQAGAMMVADGTQLAWKGTGQLISTSGAKGGDTLGIGLAEIAAGVALGKTASTVLPSASSDNVKTEATEDKIDNFDTESESEVVVYMYQSEKEMINQMAKTERKSNKKAIGKR